MGRSRDLADLISGASTLPNGAIPSGSVVQVVQTQDASNSELTVASNGAYADTTLVVSITPKFLNSTFIITGSSYMTPDTASTVCTARIVRVVNSVTTVISPASTGTSSSTAADGFCHSYNTPARSSTMGTQAFSFHMKDSGSLSLLEHTYKLQLGSSAASTTVHYNQYGEAVTSYEDNYTPTSQMVVMEIKG